MDALSSNSSRISNLANTSTSLVNAEKDKLQDKSVTEASAPHVDSMQVSKSAQEMSNSSSVNMDKVQALKNAIANGTYKINSANIAKQLLNQAF